jgi:hypothetical protein
MTHEIETRLLTGHIVNFVTEPLTITVLDAPGADGASHEYQVSYNTPDHGNVSCFIVFQNGPIQNVGVNGITNEALLAILIDRLRGFQSGAFSCRENAVALTAIEDALLWLQKRTRDRIARGVEGTDQK